MRLREAMIYAIRHGAQLAKQDRSDLIRIDGIRFVSSEFRSKYQRQPEVRLNAEECLSEDWILWKDGKEFIPNDWRT